jgi:hypothetical protein
MDTIGEEYGTNFPSLHNSEIQMVHLTDSSVSNIGYRMFAECSRLWSLSLSEKVPLQRIGSYAFYKCKNLNSFSGKY